LPIPTLRDSLSEICDEVCQIRLRPTPHGNLIVWESKFSGGAAFTFGDQVEMGLGIRIATDLSVTKGGASAILRCQVVDSCPRRVPLEPLDHLRLNVEANHWFAKQQAEPLRSPLRRVGCNRRIKSPLLIADRGDVAARAEEGVMNAFLANGGIIMLGEKCHALGARGATRVFGVLQPRRHAADRRRIVDVTYVLTSKLRRVGLLARNVSNIERELIGSVTRGLRRNPLTRAIGVISREMR
jgi:hypothetical protein